MNFQDFVCELCQNAVNDCSCFFIEDFICETCSRPNNDCECDDQFVCGNCFNNIDRCYCSNNHVNDIADEPISSVEIRIPKTKKRFCYGFFNCKNYKNCNHVHKSNICRFNNNCDRKECTRIHSRDMELCRYKNSCRNTNCCFWHGNEMKPKGVY